ncbi:MAG: divalent-cation tolerance protein CutA [Nitrososphaerales archaeon]|nr:divalent-cation tolerance protein CutA [Nitrososphaerales archaeon]
MSVDMGDYIHIVTTTSSKDEAEKIVKILVERRLAGCAQIIGPIASMYWWRGKIERAEEWLCIIKSRNDLYSEVEAVIRANHSYEVPEVLAIPIVKGSDDYIRWLNSELKRRD